MNVIIPNRAIYVNECVPKEICEKTVKKINEEKSFKVCHFNNEINLDYRDSSEVKIEDVELTKEFWKYIEKYIPDSYDGFKLVGPDFRRVYLLRYFTGQFFKKHYDGFSEDEKGNKSRITAMIYLNDMDDKSGGATRFYPSGFENIDVVPKMGRFVAFDHRILHEGMPIVQGYKYCIRFNILYENSLFFENPAPNGLKYSSVRTVINKNGIELTPNKNDKKSKDRWFEVAMRPHEFQIEPCFPGFVDTTMGRPPTLDEDYCPNCYEILPLKNNYKNCSGCCSLVVKRVK